MAEFAYYNSINTNMVYISFELNYAYHIQVSFQDECDAYSSSSSV